MNIPKLNIKIFGLDDDEAIRYKMEEAFRYASISGVTMFETKEEFFKHLDEHVHIAIIDHFLDAPMNGLEVMKELHNINPYCYVIAISGHCHETVIIDYLNEGAYKFILKDDKEFTSKLINYVNRAYSKIYEVLSHFQQKIDHLKETCNAKQ